MNGSIEIGTNTIRARVRENGVNVEPGIRLELASMQRKIGGQLERVRTREPCWRILEATQPAANELQYTAMHRIGGGLRIDPDGQFVA
jgi:hypothetical protein